MGKKTCKAAVFERVGKPIEIKEFEVPQELEPGAALCRVTLSTICGSDLHTITGRRTEPTPLILGHEIVGGLVALGDGLTKDGFGNKLQVGDRVHLEGDMIGKFVRHLLYDRGDVRAGGQEQ